MDTLAKHNKGIRDSANAHQINCAKAQIQVAGKNALLKELYAENESLRSQLAENAELRKFAESALRQFDRLKQTGQLNHGAALLCFQSFEIEAVRAAMKQQP